MSDTIDNIHNTDISIDKPGKHIPIAKLINLKKKGLSYQQIADICKCSKQNIHARLSKFEFVEDFQSNKATEYEALQYRVIKSIDDRCIQKTPFVQRTTAIAILEDKIRLIRGQSTQNSAINVQMSIEHKAIAEEVIKNIKAKELEKVINTEDNTSSDLQT